MAGRKWGYSAVSKSINFNHKAMKPMQAQTSQIPDSLTSATHLSRMSSTCGAVSLSIAETQSKETLDRSA